MRVAELKVLARERGLRGYAWLRNAELIALLQNNPPPPPPPAPRTRAPRPTRPPPPPPLQAQSVRFRPDSPRQPGLMRQLDKRNPQPPKPSTLLASPTLKPCQLKPKRGKETFMEPPMEQQEVPPPDPKKLKSMKKKLDELNRKIRHSRKKLNGLIHNETL